MKPAKGEQLTIALTKGRIFSETLPLLAEAGVSPLESVDELSLIHISEPTRR